jgi:hypothetical protein
MAYTLVEAVNICLRGIGRAPVATEDDLDADLDASTALAVINQCSREIQGKGWHFNREDNWNLYPDASGNIYAPNNILDIISWKCSRETKLTLRGRRVYDSINHTFDLRNSGLIGDGYISFLFITELPFEELPPIPAAAIIYRARRMYAQDVEGDAQNWQFNSRDEEEAMALLSSSELKNAKLNYHNNPSVSNFMAHVGGENGGLGMSGLRTFPKRRQ